MTAGPRRGLLVGMADEDAFRAAVLAQPFDHGPGLVWADWLDERGHPAGAFIRLQVELARLGPGRETVRLEGCAPDLATDADRSRVSGTLVGRGGRGPLRGRRVDVATFRAAGTPTALGRFAA